MKLATVGKPEPSEYSPFYGVYISLIDNDNILKILDQQRRDMVLLLSGRSEEDGDLRYAPGKWTVKQVLGHINDTERIHSYRALRISRGDRTPLPGFEQDDYMRESPFARLKLSDLIEDFIAVRRSTLSLLRALDPVAWLRRGTVSNCEMSVRAMVYTLAGHELHHRRILEEKYFPLTSAAAS